MIKIILIAMMMVTAAAAAATITDESTGETVELSDELINRAYGVDDFNEDAHLFDTNFFGILIGGDYRKIERVEAVNPNMYKVKADEGWGFPEFRFNTTPISGLVHTIVAMKSYSGKVMAECQFNNFVYKFAKKYNRKLSEGVVEDGSARAHIFKFIGVQVMVLMCEEKNGDGYNVLFVAKSKNLEEKASEESRYVPHALYGMTFGAIADMKRLARFETDGRRYYFVPPEGSPDFEKCLCLITPQTKRIAEISAWQKVQGKDLTNSFLKAVAYLESHFGCAEKNEGQDSLSAEVKLDDMGTTCLVKCDRCSASGNIGDENQWNIVTIMSNPGMSDIFDIEVGKKMSKMNKSHVIFGVELGRKFEDQRLYDTKRSLVTIDEIIYDFSPQKKMEDFCSYKLFLTPKSRYVYQVAAIGAFDSNTVADLRIDSIKASIKNVLGVKFTKEQAEDSPDVAYFYDEDTRPRRFTISKRKQGGKFFVMFLVCDMAFWTLNRYERQDRFLEQ